MPLDYDFRSCSRTCSASQRPLKPGDVYFSVLAWDEQQLIRLDYCAEAWPGAPNDCVGWWRSRLPTKDDTQPQLAPSDVMLNLLESLADRPAELQFRYLLGLLLLRRKILRRQESTLDDQGREVLTLLCSKRNTQYDLIVAEPGEEQAARLQQQMFDLLYGSSASDENEDAPASKPVASSSN